MLFIACPSHALVSFLMPTSCWEDQRIRPYLTTEGHCSSSVVLRSRGTRLLEEERTDGLSSSIRCQPIKVTRDAQICWAVSSFRSSLYTAMVLFHPTPQETSLYLILPAILLPSSRPLRSPLARTLYFLRGIKSKPAVVNLIPLIQLI